MASLRSFKQMLNTKDSYYNSGLRSNFLTHESTGAKNQSWGGTFKTQFLNNIRSAKSFNPGAYGSYNSFKVLAQSSVRTRIGYQVIFDPASTNGEYYTFTPTANTAIMDAGRPWTVRSNHTQGSYTETGDVSDIGTRPRNAQGAWAFDGTNFAYYYRDRWITAGSEEVANEIMYMNPRGRFYTLLSWYEKRAFGGGIDALFGMRPWTVENIIPEDLV